jgi:hypothetical protein
VRFQTHTKAPRTTKHFCQLITLERCSFDLPNRIIKLTGAKSVSTGAESVGTGAESVCTELKSQGTVPVSVFAPIVPAPTVQSRAANWLNQWPDGMRTGYAPDLSDGMHRVFKHRK